MNFNNDKDLIFNNFFLTKMNYLLFYNINKIKEAKNIP